jgi:hypothetical protein
VADSQASSGSVATGQAQEVLRRNSLNLPGLAFMGLAYFSLAVWWSRRRQLSSISLASEV